MDDKFKVIHGKNLDEGQQKLYADIQSYSAWFDMLRLQTSNRYDQMYVIFAYNLFELGLTTEGIQMINKVTAGYYENQMMNDIQHAVDQRNEAEKYKNNPKDKDKYIECMNQGEFFLVAVGLPQYLLNESNFNNKEEFVKFVNTQMTNSTYKIMLQPNIGIVKDEE